MTGLLCIYGSFTGAFSDQISHDMSYLEPISEKINLDIPTDGYISIMYDFQDSGDSLAMVKINDQNDSFASELDNNNNWKRDTSFIPSNKIFFNLSLKLQSILSIVDGIVYSSISLPFG